MFNSVSRFIELLRSSMTPDRARRTQAIANRCVGGIYTES